MSEASELRRIGAKPIKNSGRGTNKGDGILGPFLVDVKEYNKSYSVSRKDWAKLSKDGMGYQERLEPMFHLALGEEGQTPVRVWVIPEGIGLEMLEAWKEKYEVQD